jgi:putative FmdB family regulatory protein
VVSEKLRLMLTFEGDPAAADFLLDEWPEGLLAHAANFTISVFVVSAIGAHPQASRRRRVWSDRRLSNDRVSRLCTSRRLDHQTQSKRRKLSLEAFAPVEACPGETRLRPKTSTSEGLPTAIGRKIMPRQRPRGWSESMPTYQYRCEKCGEKFERTETISEHEALKATCPKCGSKKVSFVPGNVYVVTSKKS